MYKLIRRISSSFFPRPDRPWNDDATSTAPQVQIGKKRRLSVSDSEDTPSPSTPKKSRIATPAEEPSAEATQAEKDATTEGVKEVTKGVHDVELEDGEPKNIPEETTTPAEAAAVPLPESPTLKPADEQTEGASTDVLVAVEAEKEAVAEKEGEGDTFSTAEAARASEEVKETTETAAAPLDASHQDIAPPPTADLQGKSETSEKIEGDAGVQAADAKEAQEASSGSGSVA